MRRDATCSEDVDAGLIHRFSDDLFRSLRDASVDGDGDGVSRESYGRGEQAAHDICAGIARSLDLDTSIDHAGNLYMTMRGRDRAAPGWITGSHLDSVPRGGNYDGAAGVVSGLAVLAALRSAGVVPERDVTVVGIRAEEASSWFDGNHAGHLGSRAALGLLSPAELDEASSIVHRRSLAARMADGGFDPEPIRSRRASLNAAGFKGFIELHIEQGPVLEARGIPVGIVTGIRGSARARSARCIGEYTHSGAVPHEYRSDAVLATAELCHRLDRIWEEARADGADLVVTVGKFFTDPKEHSISKVPGHVTFAIDFRSQDLDTLRRMTGAAESLAKGIAERRRVRFELGEFNLSQPSLMDAGIRDRLAEGAGLLGIPALEMASGAGHDAQEFSRAGFPTAMIFVRNANGSHNPQEAMRMDDFVLGTRLLAWMLRQ